MNSRPRPPRYNKNSKHEKFDKKTKFGEKKKKWQHIDTEVSKLVDSYSQIDTSKIQHFKDLPISQNTQKGLNTGDYATPTEIQRESIGLALQGYDILGAAKTGSGKTLAFIIPVLECLYREKWTPSDGLGALIVSPTRELAYQIFSVLRKIGSFHDFSAGLVIGGKHVRDEAERITTTNIVICTPGRLLQHMDETAHFHADNLKILVLDEADRILDLGFQQTMNAVIENLPSERQTLLFSATQTKSVKDLARLSLKDPVYVSVHENAKHSTPTQLEQSYMVCELHEKMNVLWSFLKNHLKSKVLVFMTCCKQVRYVFEAMKKLRPGTTVLALHGAMNQSKRMAVYNSFLYKENAVLLATDIAARGLDFPAVNWVIQLDCPDDANTYIHRVGRTARYEKDGQSLLVLLPSEQESMVQLLTDKKIPINFIQVNRKKVGDIQPKLECLLASDIELKEFAQRAFVSYLRSIFLMSNKKVFQVMELDTDKFALSLGLAIPPRIRFIEKEAKKMEAKTAADSHPKPEQSTEALSAGQSDDKSQVKPSPVTTPPKKLSSSVESSESDEDTDDSSGSDSSDEDDEKPVGSDPKGSSSYSFNVEDEDLDDILTVKTKKSLDTEDLDELPDVEIELAKSRSKAVSKFAAAKKLLRKDIKLNIKVLYDEEGNEVKDAHKKSQKKKTEVDEEVGGININAAKQRMQEEDKFDKQLYREKIQKRHREERYKEKDRKRKLHQSNEDDEEVPEAILATEDTGADYADLPDPDKLYGKRAGEDGENNLDENYDSAEYDEATSDESEVEDEDEESEDADDAEPPAKRKRPIGVSGEHYSSMDTGLTLMDDEELALQLLKS